jgi:DNA polymerase III delta prime subunit
MQNVLWIAGPPAVGKTTVATTLARRYGLRLYSADTRTWAHRDRAIEAGIEAARRWESLRPRERWDGPSAAELLEMSLHRERGQMVFDDLRALPDAPLIIAEETVLPAWAVSAGIVDSASAVWLIPTVEFHEQQLAGRGAAGGVLELYRLLRSVIEREAGEHGVATLSLDGSQDAGALYSLIEQRFGALLASGPTATTLFERRALLREINQSLVGQVRGFYSRPWAEGNPETLVRSFLCECGEPGCDAIVSCTIAEAASAPVVVPVHR